MKYLIIGSKGQLGSHFCKVFNQNGFNYTGMDIDTIDITDLKSVNDIFDTVKPDIVINCAAYNLVEDAEKNSAPALAVNERGVRNLAEVCEKNNTFLVHYGTNYVFDGKKGTPYTETDKTNPINEYGKSKLAGENAIKEVMQSNYLILRTSWLYGEGIQNFIYKFLKRISEGKELVGTIDDIATPTSTRILVDLTLRSLDSNLRGTYHAVNSGSASRWDWAKEISILIGKDIKIKKCKIDSFNLLAKVPKDAILDNSKISKDLNIQIPNWKDELKQFITEQNYFDLKF